jgi:phage baseplate assembly protein W
MIGMSATTGKAISGRERLAQRIWIILTTPIGSRTMRRDFGSMLLALMDQPINAAMPMLLRAATVIALTRWLPTFTVTRVTLSGNPAAGELTIGITGKDATAADPNELVSLSTQIRRASAAS